jgi:competence protein ComEA
MKALFLTLTLVCLAFLAGCSITPPSQQSSQDVKERTANATAALKADAKAAAAGVREGWNRDKALDVNKASKEDLLTLPGMTPEKADKVIAARPYNSTGQLVTRGILSQSQYDKIKARLVAKP